jgi:aryl-alcohol dehydrogenase-like predicted oxidoreductase
LQPPVLEAVAELVPLAAEAGVSMVQMAVAWVLRQANVSSAIVGASRPEQLDDSVSASGVVLDDDLLAAIDAALAGVVIDDPAHTAQASPPQRP